MGLYSIPELVDSPEGVLSEKYYDQAVASGSPFVLAMTASNEGIAWRFMTVIPIGVLHHHKGFVFAELDSKGVEKLRDLCQEFLDPSYGKTLTDDENESTPKAN